MAGLATSVATAAGAGSTYAQRRAISLDMAKTLTVVTLLRCGRLVSVPLPNPEWPGCSSICGVYILSVVRGSGHPFDSCPEPLLGISWDIARMATANAVTYQVVCLVVGLAVTELLMRGCDLQL